MKCALIGIAQLAWFLFAAPHSYGGDLLKELGQVREYASKCLADNKQRAAIRPPAPMAGDVRTVADKDRVHTRTPESRIVRLLRRSAKRHSIDENLAISVALVESGLDQAAISAKGAVGVMQIMPSTAMDLGINPHNVEENIDGGLRYLKRMIDEFGLGNGLAAYNFGPENVRADKPWPKETREYVERVLKQLRTMNG